ncbi:chorismate synthase [Candidatus Clostridium radicumherbarum]|uniref:Chorismate synthase n=1 Tax=Candidatus Clostridium radicumherbarum TaxID=3381662 RepID=A0ABW8TT02_9CLOT
MLKYLDAGESHGKALVAVIEGLPSNFNIDIDYINNELKRRQSGYGRGARMLIEKDKVEIWSGMRGTYTTGNPLTMVIYNRDYENWKEKLGKRANENEAITIPRPGHGDLVGYIKYNTGDIRDVIERTSARETAMRTAVGALCKDMLRELNIIVRSKVNSIGNICDVNTYLFDNKNYEKIEESEVRCYNNEIEDRIKKEIDICKAAGETIGGSIFLSIKGVPIGIGSYTQWDMKLDGILSRAIMSLQGIKAVEFGNGLNLSLKGSSFNDELFYENGGIIRKSNNAGGIEAGVSNGEDIEIKAYMKPIPTVRKEINTIDLKHKKNMKSRYERSDVCAVVPASIVLENICAFEILKELLSKFPSEDFNLLKKSIENYNREINER